MPHAFHTGDAAGASAHAAPPPIPLSPQPRPDAPSSAPPRAAATHAPHGNFHPLPVIGHAEAFYVKHIAQAEAAGDRHAKAAHKVGQYVTAALDPKMAWDDKMKRFFHCLDKYCIAPPSADESLRTFYHKLGDLVRKHAGQEALAAARRHHAQFSQRLKASEDRGAIEDDAEKYFFDLLGHGHGCPNWCSKEAFHQIVTWRDQWV
jgi:hypothetical protein